MAAHYFSLRFFNRRFLSAAILVAHRFAPCVWGLLPEVKPAPRIYKSVDDFGTLLCGKPYRSWPVGSDGGLLRFEWNRVAVNQRNHEREDGENECHLSNPHETGIALSRQDAPSQTLPQHARQDMQEPASVGLCAVVESHHLFDHVAAQVVGGDGNVSAAQHPLDHGPVRTPTWGVNFSRLWSQVVTQ